MLKLFLGILGDNIFFSKQDIKLKINTLLYLYMFFQNLALKMSSDEAPSIH